MQLRRLKCVPFRNCGNLGSFIANFTSLLCLKLLSKTSIKSINILLPLSTMIHSFICIRYIYVRTLSHLWRQRSTCVHLGYFPLTKQKQIKQKQKQNNISSVRGTIGSSSFLPFLFQSRRIFFVCLLF